MKFPDKGSLFDLLKGSISTLTLFLAYVMFPLVGMIPGVFAPFPAIFYALKRGKLTGVAIVAIVTVVLAIVADSSAILLYLLQCGAISLSLPALLAAGKSGARSIATAVAINVGVILVVAGIYAAAGDGDLHAQVLKGIESSISQTVALYDKAGVTGEDLKALQQGMVQAGAVIGRIYPSLVVVSLAVIAGLNLMLLGKVSTRLSCPLSIGKFAWFKNPEQLVWVLIVAGFAMLVPNRELTTAAMNILVITLSLYFMQGMAVIVHFYTRLAIPRFMRVFLYLCLALQPYLALAVAVLGIFDIWGDFRTPRKPKNL
ncbi:MAG: DUF2232 domain-containing protein [Geobacter sp.]|nr:MAG: DUF2232 domain-containing protein [Geobacter sp.]